MVGPLALFLSGERFVPSPTPTFVERSKPDGGPPASVFRARTSPSHLLTPRPKAPFYTV